MSEGSYISFGVEGVPYSQVHVELTGDGDSDETAIERAVYFASKLADEYKATFYPPFPETQQEPRGVEVLHQGNVGAVPLPDEEYAPSEPVRVPLDPETGREVGFVERVGTRVTGERFACPNCNKPAQQSLDQYQQWEVGSDGREYPQKFFCPNKDCSTKSLWRSKLVALAPAGASR